MAKRTSALGRNVNFLGRFKLPLVALMIVLATFAATVGGTFLQRHGVEVITYGILMPEKVLDRQIWRLLTWVFIDLRGTEDRWVINLLFLCLILYFTGRDLCQKWGWRRFLATYCLFAVGIGALTVFIGLLWKDVWFLPHMGGWPMADALIIAWACEFPDRQIRLFFVLPVGGRWLIGASLVITLIFALVYGFAQMVPTFLAQLFMLAHAGHLRNRYARWKKGRADRQRKTYLANIERIDREEDIKGPPSGKPPGWLN